MINYYFVEFEWTMVQFHPPVQICTAFKRFNMTRVMPLYDASQLPSAPELGYLSN